MIELHGPKDPLTAPHKPYLVVSYVAPHPCGGLGHHGSARTVGKRRQLAPPAQGPTPPIRSMEYRTMYPV